MTQGRDWKVYKRPDGRTDFITSVVPTRYEVVADDLTLGEAIEMSDRLNKERLETK